MDIEESAGAAMDHKIWVQILTNSDDINSHILWVSLIKSVANFVISNEVNINDYSLDDIDEKETELIENWLENSMPYSDHLAYVLGELDYFRDIDMSWNDKINLSGEPCGYIEDVVLDLKDKLEGIPDAKEAITEDAVQSFYTFWRSRFLKQVLEAVKNSNNTYKESMRNT